jgi:hypothetical protein
MACTAGNMLLEFLDTVHCLGVMIEQLAARFLPGLVTLGMLDHLSLDTCVTLGLVVSTVPVHCQNC